MIGETVSHYRILERLGEGGMGVVYKAQDTHLDRPVALKFLPPHLGTDKDARARFIREAKSASSLEHTNICTIFDIDETEDNRLFIAMSCYEGESLKDKIERGPLPVDEAVDYAIQIAQGLSLAHEAGIIHRDIKPGNVMITSRGVVKIVDFGLAKMAESSLTKTGKTLGTAMYMSPEQARGDIVDHRTDIWSLGIVFSEMITGVPPFRGEYDAALLYQVVNEQPCSLDEQRANIPPHLVRAIMTCLEKMPENRFQSMEDFQTALTDPMGQITEPEEKEISIVVLPFVNMSSDPEQEYFSDGLTEEIISDLSQLDSLRVISRNSAMLLKGKKKETAIIGAELHVQYVLEGSVRKSGNNLRITVQLIDIPRNTPIWTEKYTGSLDDVFDIQEMVSRAIIRALKVKLSLAEDLKLAERSIRDVFAFECYLKARKESMRMTESSFRRALDLLDDGIAKVGDNEVLFSMAGQLLVLHLMFGIKADDRYLTKASEYARRVFELNSVSSYGHFLSGLIKYKEKDLKGAIFHLRTSFLAESDDPSTLFWLSLLYIISGEETAARPLIERLIRIDPLVSQNYSLLGYYHLVRGDFTRANTAYYKMYMLDPQNELVRICYARGLAFNHQIDEAVSILERFSEDIPQTVFSRLGLFFKSALKGEKREALDFVSDELLESAEWDEHSAWYLADSYALLGNKERALNWLDKAIDRGLRHYRLLSEYDHFLSGIRDSERFEVLMMRLKGGWTQSKLEEKRLSKLDSRTEKSIIVLPFVNMSPDPDQEYFSDGLTEEIITDLSHVGDLLVISRNSAMTFKGTKKKTREIARDVNVSYVLEGSVRKAGNNLRITAQLIDATTDAHLWAEKYRGTLDDVFDIQEEVSSNIVNALKIKLSPEENKRIAERPIDNVQAFEYYLKANAEISRFTEESINSAIRYLQNAIDIIGENALLYSGMAWACWQLVNIGAKQEDYLEKAVEYLNKALIIYPAYPRAYTLFGWIALFRGKMQEALDFFKQSLSLNPDELMALQGLAASVYPATGRLSAAVPLSQKIIEYDPLDFITLWIQGAVYFYDGRFEEALHGWGKMYETYPDNPFSRFYYPLVLVYQDQSNIAFDIIDQNIDAYPNHVMTKMGIMLKCARNGEKNRVISEMTEEFVKTSQRDPFNSQHLSSVFSLLNEKTEATDWVNNAVNRGFINYPFLNDYDPFLENIRGEPRFKKLMERVKYEWEHFEV